MTEPRGLLDELQTDIINAAILLLKYGHEEYADMAVMEAAYCIVKINLDDYTREWVSPIFKRVNEKADKEGLGSH